jgi:uncharacterized protein
VAGHLRKLVAVGDIRGAVSSVETLVDTVADTDVDAIVAVGDLTEPRSKPETWRVIFKALGRAGRPAFWVPGATDAPIREYLRESYNVEIVYPRLRGVHGTAAVGPESVLFVGMGGEIQDDPDALREEEALLRYPGWEVEYRLKAVREFKDYPRVFLFTTRPAHKGLGEPGSEVLAELVKTHSPRVVVVSGDEPAEEMLGTSLIVCPGRLDRGEYAIVDFHDRSVEAATLSAHATASS